MLNRKTARRQVLGSIVGGIHDSQPRRLSRPGHADVHHIDVIFVAERDDIVNPLGAKGLGEIGIVGVAAAIANAVFHATGKRARDLPITLDTLL